MYNQLYLFLEEKKRYYIWIYTNLALGKAPGSIEEDIQRTWTQQLITNKLPVAYYSISQGHLMQLPVIFCSLNCALMESVALHLNGLKASYAITLNI